MLLFLLLSALVPLSLSCPHGSLPSDHKNHKDESPYNLAQHVWALVTILLVSYLGAATPLAIQRFPRLRIPKRTLTCIKHFGTGIIVSTACTHLLPSAFESLHDVKWIERYPATPGAIIVAGMLLVFFVDVFIHSRDTPAITVPGVSPTNQLERGNGYHQLATPLRTTPENSPHLGNEPKVESVQPIQQRRSSPHLRIILLEASILVHTIFIGFSISLITTGLWSVVIAFSFHQLFEGLALGVRISELLVLPSSNQTGGNSNDDNTTAVAPPGLWARIYPWILVSLFALTGPIGQAIGLGVHSTVIGDKARGVSGVVHALSAGMLIYTALVDLIAVEYFGEEAAVLEEGKSGVKKMWAVLLLVIGCAAMAVIAAYA